MGDLTPNTREEYFLARMAGEDVTMPEPITREEEYMKGIASQIEIGSASMPYEPIKVIGVYGPDHDTVNYNYSYKSGDMIHVICSITPSIEITDRFRLNVALVSQKLPQSNGVCLGYVRAIKEDNSIEDFAGYVYSVGKSTYVSAQENSDTMFPFTVSAWLVDVIFKLKTD